MDQPSNLETSDLSTIFEMHNSVCWRHADCRSVYMWAKIDQHYSLISNLPSISAQYVYRLEFVIVLNQWKT